MQPFSESPEPVREAHGLGRESPPESDTLIHSLNLQSGEEREITFQIPWRDARLWSPDDPYLYSLETVLEEGDILMDRLFPQRFGFREFTVSGRNYLLKRTADSSVQQRGVARPDF